MNCQFQCWFNYFMHHYQNQLLLLLFGALLVCDINSSFSGMAAIYTAAAASADSFDASDGHDHRLVERNSGNSGSSGSSGSTSMHYFFRKHCPDGPPPQWASQLDVASKAYLAPIVFYGKLISVSEDYAGRIGATFRVQKLIKNSGTLAPNLVLGTQVMLYFVRNVVHKSEPPHCAIYMNDNLVKLRPEDKYIIFASPPVTIHTNSVYNVANSNSNHQLVRSIANSHTVINLSAFASPELHNKRSSRQVRKVLCTRCARTPLVRGLNGDLRVETKGRLRLRCKVSGNPSPWVEWFRNGKRLKSRGRVGIRTRRRISRLEVRNVSPLTDSGYYECRAMNVVAREPSIARQKVIITPLSRGKYVPKTPSSSSSSTTTRGPLWPQVRPCPIASFCLNGGTCTLYEAVGEYVCQCAEGYRGQRCESKDVYAYRHQHLHQR